MPTHENARAFQARGPFHPTKTPPRTTDPPSLSSSTPDRRPDTFPNSCWSEHVRANSPVSEATDGRPCTYPYRMWRGLERQSDLIESQAACFPPCINSHRGALAKATLPTSRLARAASADTYTRPCGHPIDSVRRSLSQNQAMSAQRLYELDKSSTRFPEQLEKLLDDKEWIDHLRALPRGDVPGLISHLDEVWPTTLPAVSRPLPHRFSIASITRAQRSGSISACCGKFAVTGRSSPQRMA